MTLMSARGVWSVPRTPNRGAFLTSETLVPAKSPPLAIDTHPQLAIELHRPGRQGPSVRRLVPALVGIGRGGSGARVLQVPFHIGEAAFQIFYLRAKLRDRVRGTDGACPGEQEEMRNSATAASNSLMTLLPNYTKCSHRPFP